MSSSHLRLRENWQTLSGNLASVAEQNFADVFNNLLADTDYMLNTSPRDLANIYYNYPLLDRDKE